MLESPEVAGRQRRRQRLGPVGADGVETQLQNLQRAGRVRGGERAGERDGTLAPEAAVREVQPAKRRAASHDAVADGSAPQDANLVIAQVQPGDRNLRAERVSERRRARVVDVVRAEVQPS